ncbi:MAG TPA: DNA adenine methylase [Planktothrix sp.]
MQARKRTNKRLYIARGSKESASPFLKWAGGKGQLLRQFEAYYPAKMGRYLEPFIGGGAVFFDMAAKNDELSATISDANPDLINCYSVVRDHVEELIEALKKHRNDKHYYYSVRSQDARTLCNIERAARLIYLNKTCFNGLYRVNRSGQFNVPFGKYKNPKIADEANLRLVSQVLQRATIQCGPFERILEQTRAGDFVYLDPPYQPISATSSFTSYTARAFGAKDQERLSEFVKQLDKRGCYVMVSNSDNQFIEEIYSGFHIHRVSANRAINCKASGRGRITELLITNYKPNRS